MICSNAGDETLLCVALHAFTDQCISISRTKLLLFIRLVIMSGDCEHPLLVYAVAFRNGVFSYGIRGNLRCLYDVLKSFVFA